MQLKEFLEKNYPYETAWIGEDAPDWEKYFPAAWENYTRENDPLSEPIINIKIIAENFNTYCPSHTPVLIVSEDRKQRIRLRFEEMKEAGLDPYQVFDLIFKKIEASHYCKGNNQLNWWATFDWIIKNSDNWVKTYEGNYDNKPLNNGNNGNNQRFSNTDEIRREGFFNL